MPLLFALGINRFSRDEAHDGSYSVSLELSLSLSLSSLFVPTPGRPEKLTFLFSIQVVISLHLIAFYCYISFSN